MRIPFHPPTQNEFREIFAPLSRKRGLKGGALDDIRTYQAPYLRSGGGFFGTLAGIARHAMPFIMRAVAPSAIDFGKNVLSDLSSGKRDVKSALKSHGFDALKTVGRKLVTGGRIKRLSRRKTHTTKQTRKKRKCKQSLCYKDDVFSVT